MSKLNLSGPLVFEPIFMERIWGGRRLESEFGKKLPAQKRIGESWEIVDRPEAQSVVVNGPLRGKTLHELWIQGRSEIFGNVPDASRFPLLVKLLDAHEKLSLQVHPPEKVASKLGGEPKTEFWYVVAADPGAELYLGFRESITRDQFEKTLRDGTAADHVHKIRVKTGDAAFLPAGRFHALGAGNLLIEIQQNSDTTYRVFDWNRVGLNGEPRELHIQSSLASIDFSDFEPSLGEVVEQVIVSCNHFQVERWSLTESRSAHSRRQFAVFQCVSGKVEFAGQYFRPGDLFLATAEGHTKTLSPLDSNTTVLRTTIEKT